MLGLQLELGLRTAVEAYRRVRVRATARVSVRVRGSIRVGRVRLGLALALLSGLLGLGLSGLDLGRG